MTEKALSQALFIVPVAQTDKGYLYEAIVNR